MNPELRIAHRNNKSFTLIELLVVLALVAILSVVVVMTLNPAELIKQARDSNRLSDLSTINTALNLFSTDVASGFMGTSTIVYISIPDTSPTCANLGLPTLPTSTINYTYNCVTASNLRNTNGTGWIPVNFQRISSNSPISQLPIDPINTTSTGKYYTYISGGSWELNASIEASKNKLGGSNDLVSKDGGSEPSTYEAGNNLSLSPIEVGDESLVGYWNFENDILDHSGNKNNGIWYGTSTERYISGRVGGFAGYFNGSGDYVGCGVGTSTKASAFSVSAWTKYETATSFPIFSWANNYPTLYMKFSLRPLIYLAGGNYRYFSITSPIPVTDGNWHHVVFTVPGGSISDISSSRMYVDGVAQNIESTTSAATEQAAKTTCMIGKSGVNYAGGDMDDVRIYNRALSATEVLAIYNATK